MLKTTLIFLAGTTIILLSVLTLDNQWNFVYSFKPSNAPQVGDRDTDTVEYDPNKMLFLLSKGGIGSEELEFNMNYGLWLVDNGKIEGGFETSNGEDYFIKTASTYNDGNWHNAIITFDSENKILKLYVDGEEINDLNTNTAKPDTTGNGPVRLGANSFDYDNYKVNGNYTGLLDDIQVWS